MAAKQQASTSGGRTTGQRLGKLLGKLLGAPRFVALRLLPWAALATLIALPGSGNGDGEHELRRPAYDYEPSGALFADGVAANLEARATLVDDDGDDEADQAGDGEDPTDGWNSSTAAVIDSLGRSGIPEVALEAYVQAQETTAISDPTCHVRWSLLAAIGRVESNHGRFGGARLRADGYGTKPIRGIPLDGRAGVAVIRDTDDGRLDGDAIFDRAVGPMQFIPSSWPIAAADGNGDGRSDPNNIFDAALAAASYLCGGGGDLRDASDRRAAVLRYNHSEEYADVVLSLAAAYERGRTEPLPHVEPAPTSPPVLPTPPKPPASHTKPPVAPPSHPPTRPPTDPPTTRPPGSSSTSTTSSSSTSTSTSSSTTSTSTTQPCPTTTLPPTTSTSSTSTTSTTTTTTTTTTTLPGGSTTTTSTTVPNPGCPPPPTTTTTTAPTTATTNPSSTTTQTTSPAPSP